MLANLGAEVLLIEPPDGDPMRRQGPFKNDTPHRERSLSFAAYHTNKQGAVLILKTPMAAKRFRAMARHADVVIEDKPVGYLDSYGLASLSCKSSIPRW